MMKLIASGKQNDGMDLNTNAIGMNSNSTTIDLNKKKNIFIQMVVYNYCKNTLIKQVTYKLLH